MENKIAAVVVTYNRKQLLEESIQSLLKQTYQGLDILVIDNASTDGTEELVSQFTDPRVIYINTGSNLGGAGGFQFGVNQGVERGYDYLWLMDDDSIPQPSALRKLIDFAQSHSNFGFLSSKVLWKDHSLCKMNIPKKSLKAKLDQFDDGPQSIIMATFVSFFVSTKVVKQVGLPIKEFFIWADDLEYSRRISRIYPCYFIPDSIVIHKCKSNNGSNIATDSEDRLNRYRYAYRNEVYIYRREGLTGWLYLVLKDGFHVVRVIGKAKSRKKERLQIIWKSAINGLSFHPTIQFPK